MSTFFFDAPALFEHNTVNLWTENKSRKRSLEKLDDCIQVLLADVPEVQHIKKRARRDLLEEFEDEFQVECELARCGLVFSFEVFFVQ